MYLSYMLESFICLVARVTHIPIKGMFGIFGVLFCVHKKIVPLFISLTAELSSQHHSVTVTGC